MVQMDRYVMYVLDVCYILIRYKVYNEQHPRAGLIISYLNVLGVC